MMKDKNNILGLQEHNSTSEKALAFNQQAKTEITIISYIYVILLTIGAP